jgi:hemerythrin-like domain-containing protein
MVHEHSEERAAKACIEEALRAKAGRDFVRSARRLSLLLRSHFSSEDSVLGDLAGKLLSDEQDNEIVAKFRKYQPQSHPDFAYLERKYRNSPPKLGAVARSAGVVPASHHR